MQLLSSLFSTPVWWSYLFRILLVYLATWILHRLAGRIARRFIILTRVAQRQQPLRRERLKTLQGLIANVITFFSIIIANVIALRILNIAANTIVWVVGLFAAGLGLAARPIVSDLLTGIGFLFEDPYDVGEKVEILPGVQGIIEEVSLSKTIVRASTGEIYVVPNGEVRVVRNFSRGRFSAADVKFKVASADLERTLQVLQELNRESMSLLPHLLEPWRVISPEGIMGEHIELTITAKTRFGRAAETRPALLTLVQKELAEAGIALV